MGSNPTISVIQKPEYLQESCIYAGFSFALFYLYGEISLKKQSFYTTMHHEMHHEKERYKNRPLLLFNNSFKTEFI